jgi:hypothetical protein
MLTYASVMQASLAKFKSAVDDWSQMKAKLDSLAEDARTKMAAKAKDDDWQGTNAGVAKPFIDKTAKEFGDAAKSADGIHKVLQEGYQAFKKAQDDLKQITDVDAPAQGLVVQFNGTVEAAHPVAETSGPGARNDPDYPALVRKETQAIEALRRRIDAVLDACDDADVACSNALNADITTDEHNFSPPKYTSLDAEEAARAADLARKVTGDGGTARNVEALKQLQELMDDNAKDPEFSTAFYRNMGPEGTLDFYAKLSLDSTGLGPAGQDRVNMVQHIQGDMGSMLGIATSKETPGHLGAAWTTALMKAGHKEIDVSGVAGYNTRIYGYQALGAILRDGAYDKEFLTAVGRDMVAMERANPNVWEDGLPLDRNLALNHDKTGGRGFYPLTGLMEAMSGNPDAATAFFNEPVREDSNKDGLVTLADKPVSGGYGKAQGTVDYMLDRRDLVDLHDTTADGENSPGRRALGHALEAAVSGQANPHLTNYAHGRPHTEEMAGLFSHIVDKVGDKPEMMDDALSGSMGRMSAEYIADIEAEMGFDSGKFKGDGSHATFERGNLVPFLDRLGRHEDSYKTMSAAQYEYTQGAMQAKIDDRSLVYEDLKSELRHVAQTDGEINGILAGGRIDSALEDQFETNDKYNKGLEFGGSASGFAAGKIFEGVASRVPIAGELAGWVMEEGINADIEDAKKEPYEGAATKIREAYISGLGDPEPPIQEQMDHLTLRPGMNRDVLKHDVTDASVNGYTAGMGLQQGAGTNHGR